MKCKFIFKSLILILSLIILTGESYAQPLVKVTIKPDNGGLEI